MQSNISGPYIIWLDYGTEGWKPTSYEDLKSALEADKYCNNWIITKIVKYEVKEENND